MIGCVGDVVLDVSVRLLDTVRHDTDTPAEIQHRQGGSAANVAVEAARLCGESRFIGVIGTDPAGDRLAAELQSHGVAVCGTRVGRTGCVVALLNEAGEATMLTDRAAANQLNEWSPEWLDRLTALHVTSYALFVEPIASTTKSLITQAQTRAIPVSIDVSSVGAVADFGISLYVETLFEIQPNILFANAAEAELLLSCDELLSKSDRDIAQRTETLLSLAEVVVIKQGPDPVILLCRESVGADETKLEIAVPKLAAVTDTLGAGDAFAAGFLSAKAVNNLTWQEATTAAVEVATDLLNRRL